MHKAQGSRLKAQRMFICALVGLWALSLGPWALNASTQQLLDRVLARVESGVVLTLSDLRAAQGLGLASGSDPLQALIDRELLLIEVQRFPPPEPTPAAVDVEAAALRASAGAGLSALMQSTGIDDLRIRELARQSLRIHAYLDQRFGTDVQVSDDEVDRYYRTHQDEFLRDGQLMPFAEAEPLARQRASAARRKATIDQWIGDLRARADVVRTGG